jgi:hypothetical protein
VFVELDVGVPVKVGVGVFPMVAVGVWLGVFNGVSVWVAEAAGATGDGHPQRRKIAISPMKIKIMTEAFFIFIQFSSILFDHIKYRAKFDVFQLIWRSFTKPHINDDHGAVPLPDHNLWLVRLVDHHNKLYRYNITQKTMTEVVVPQ